MTFNSTRAWIEAARGFGDATHPERYAISTPNGFLAIAGEDERITTVDDLGRAHVFHTHEKAVTTARQLSLLMGRIYEVVKLQPMGCS
jgi:hypothetical protein